MRVKPTLMSLRKPPRTHCARGHEISGYNARPSTRDSPPACRGCHTAELWAKRNNLFKDNPRVIEHANQLIERYLRRNEETMAATAIRSAGAQAASPGAAYVIDTSIVDIVHANLTQSGLEVQAVKVTADQLPRFNVFPAGLRISHLEQARRAKFTDCELQTLTLIAEGLSNPEIAQRLHVAVDTVKTNIRRVFRKLGVKDRAHAVAVGYQRGILGGA